MTLSNGPIGAGVYAGKDTVFLFSPSEKAGSFNVSSSSDGIEFRKLATRVKITNESDARNLENISRLHISTSGRDFLLTYKSKAQKSSSLFIATSKDLVHFKKIGKVSTLKEAGMMVPDFKYKDLHVMYFGEESIKVAYSKNLKTWKVIREPLLSGDDSGNSLIFGGVSLLEQGILVLYAQSDGEHFWLRGALFDREDPQRIIWQTPYPIWETAGVWSAGKPVLEGVIVFADKLISYWEVNGDLLSVNHDLVKQLLALKHDFTSIFLTRIRENPILKPIFSHFWESKAVFNAAAIYDDGKVHLIYRAIGDNDMSMLGYASSLDGVNIDERLSEPIYVPNLPFERGSAASVQNFSQFLSGGGGNGGSEDPRITKIDGRFYMTYVAFDGSNPPRVALTSIAEGDFLNHRWNWEIPVLISPPGVVDKNACILPEKVNGKYVIFHRIYPNILIDFVDDLDFDGETRFLKGEFKIGPRAGYWDSRKVGIGAVPIKTQDGWLAVYQAVGDADPGKYKIGAMLLSLDDPTVVVARSSESILEPIANYENEGFKGGVVYPCGAVTIEDALIVYYGGADTVLCAAGANINEFTKALLSNRSPKLAPSWVRRVSN